MTETKFFLNIYHWKSIDNNYGDISKWNCKCFFSDGNEKCDESVL